MPACNTTGSVVKGTLGLSTAQLRYRTSYTGGNPGVYAKAASVRINSTFYNQANAWAAEFSKMSRTIYGSTTANVDWWGHAGVVGHCGSDEFSWHQTARAFDLAQIRLNNDSYMDCNYSWRSTSSLAQKRRYLSAALLLRCYFKNVLTFKFNAEHENHIHFDNGAPLIPLDYQKVDTLLIQMAAKWLNSSSNDINGVWTDDTTADLNSLKAVKNMSCLHPRSNLANMQYFLRYLAWDAWDNVPASKYKDGSC